MYPSRSFAPLTEEDINPFYAGYERALGLREKRMRHRYLPQMLEAELQERLMRPKMQEAQIRNILEGTLPYQQALTKASPLKLALEGALYRSRIKQIEEGEIPYKQMLAEAMKEVKMAEQEQRKQAAKLSSARIQEIMEGKIPLEKRKALSPIERLLPTSLLDTLKGIIKAPAEESQSYGDITNMGIPEEYEEVSEEGSPMSIENLLTPDNITYTANQMGISEQELLNKLKNRMRR